MFTSHIAIHQRFAAGSPVSAPPAANGAPAKENSAAIPFFFYPANSWKHKNHETLLLAYGIYHARALAAGTPPWPLLLTGHEDARWSELRTLAKTLGLLSEDAVRFRGYGPPRESARLWDTAGALVFPSLHEGFGIPLVEAMQHDLPVLASRDGSLPEVGADACLYADARRPEALADAMTLLATDAALRAGLVAKGRQRRADFSLGRESGHLLDAILELSRGALPYRPRTRGIFTDGWTEGVALLALPDDPSDSLSPSRLTLRFHALPVSRRVRLRAGATVALGTFTVPSYQAAHEISVDFRPTGGALWLEVPDAANLDPADARTHGVHLLSADLRLASGRQYPLFNT